MPVKRRSRGVYINSVQSFGYVSPIVLSSGILPTVLICMLPKGHQGDTALMAKTLVISTLLQ